MLWYVLNGIYLIVWSALLLHCLARLEYYPIIGRRWGTKVFWLLTFVFFNPLLSLLYLIFAVLLKPPKTADKPKPVYFGSVIAVICVGFVLVLFELPLDGFKAEPVVITGDSQTVEPESWSKTFLKYEPYLGTIKATNKVQTYRSVSTGTSSRVSIRNIMLISYNPHRLLDRVAREFQRSLARLPYVEKVSYYPYGTWPQNGGLLPDVFITMDMPEFNEDNLLHNHKLEVKIELQAGNSLFGSSSDSFDTDKCPVLQFNIESELRHSSKMVGLESPKAKYKLEANNISGELIKSIRKQFENLLDRYGELPQLPAMLYGTYHEPPEYSFIADKNILCRISGSGLLKDNDTIWQFADERQTDEALNSYYELLEAVGWTVDGRDDNYLRMRNGGERIHIYRQRRRYVGTEGNIGGVSKKPLSRAPIIARYELCWSGEQMRKVMDKLLDIDVDIKTLLVLKEYFQTSEQRARLCSFIEQSSAHMLDGYLVLTEYLINRGELERARETLMLARAMQYAQKGNNVKAQEIENLGERLGVENLAEVAVTEEAFREIGFINVEEIDNRMVAERELDEPLMFYKLIEGGQLQTLTLRIVNSREPLPSTSYRLQTVEKRRGVSSSSEKDGTLGPNGKWIAESYLQSLTEDGNSLHLIIESLEDEKFRFTVTTEVL